MGSIPAKLLLLLAAASPNSISTLTSKLGVPRNCVDHAVNVLRGEDALVVMSDESIALTHYGRFLVDERVSLLQ